MAKEKICLNCSGFRVMTGNRGTASRVSGECRSGSPMPGGTRWATVKGDDWCRDAFEQRKPPSKAPSDQTVGI